MTGAGRTTNVCVIGGEDSPLPASLFHHLGHKERCSPGLWPGVSPALRASLAKLPLMVVVHD